jgi:hypothetical protein
MVYDEAQPNGNVSTTASISFDPVGAFSNQPYHCQGTGPDPLVNTTSIHWRNCTAKDSSVGAGYTTSFLYNPNDYTKVSIRQAGTCGTDPERL